MNAIFRYPGAKWKIAKKIVECFPEHHSYLEPFFGSGAVLFNKERSAIETVNDIDGEVINLFDWIKKDPERLAREIYFTPYARDEYERAYAAMYTETDSFKRAVNLIVRMMMARGYRTTGEKVGWKRDIQARYMAYARGSYWYGLPKGILEAAERIRGVQIENRTALDLIRQFNHQNVLIYADPPYVLSTRYKSKKQYRYEMTDDEHLELIDALKEHSGFVVISGYESDLYNDGLSGWFKARTMVKTQMNGVREEVLWMNFNPEEV